MENKFYNLLCKLFKKKWVEIEYYHPFTDDLYVFNILTDISSKTKVWRNSNNNWVGDIYINIHKVKLDGAIIDDPHNIGGHLNISDGDEDVWNYVIMDLIREYEETMDKYFGNIYAIIEINYI